MAARCAVDGCKEQAVWAWQPFGPDDWPLRFALLGSHYRGFPVVKVCDGCKATLERSLTTVFRYKGHDYTMNGHDMKVYPGRTGVTHPKGEV